MRSHSEVLRVMISAYEFWGRGHNSTHNTYEKQPLSQTEFTPINKTLVSTQDMFLH